MRGMQWLIVLVVAVVASAATYVITTRRQPPPQPVATIGTIREVMKGIVDPSSDGIFESVASVSNASGVVDKAPHTDEEWAAVQGQALTLAEAATLLTIPGRPVAGPGEVDPPGIPDAPELTAPQIQAKIAADPTKWLGYANALQKVALKALDVTKKRDVNGLFEIGDGIDTACENCHLEYWYPANSKPGAAAAAPASSSSQAR